MAIPLPPIDTEHSDKVLRRLAREQREEQEARKTVWAFLWILFTFKICTVALIWYVAAGSGESMAMIISTTWYWLAIPIIAVSGRFLYGWRVMRMRRRREELKRAEWRVDPEVVIRQVGDGEDRQW